MTPYEKRPYYKPRLEPKPTPILSCILAVIGAFFMVAMFIAAVAAVGQ